MNEVKKILDLIEAPWEVASVSYVRDVSQNPRRITIELAAKKGQLFPYPECGQMNKLRREEENMEGSGLGTVAL